MREIGEILEDIQNRYEDEKLRQLAKELTNACGSVAANIRKEVLDQAFAESESLGDSGEEYISLSSLSSIVATAGDNL